MKHEGQGTVLKVPQQSNGRLCTLSPRLSLLVQFWEADGLPEQRQPVPRLDWNKDAPRERPGDRSSFPVLCQVHLWTQEVTAGGVTPREPVSSPSYECQSALTAGKTLHNSGKFSALLLVFLMENISFFQMLSISIKLLQNPPQRLLTSLRCGFVFFSLLPLNPSLSFWKN